jgi:hypothetical protein
MTDTLELRYMPLEALRRWDRNAKRHDLGALVASIARHGFRDPPAYDAALNGGEGGVVEGNGRGDALSAMLAEGRPVPRGIVAEGDTWLVPVLFGVDAPSQAAAEAYGVAHNQLTMAGGDFTALDMASLWEPAGYAALLEDLAKQGEIPVGLDGEDVDALLRELVGTPAPAEDEPVSVPKDGPTRCQPGDVWRVGRHLVACLDSTDAEAVRRLVARRKVGMVWADPPYGIAIVQGNKIGASNLAQVGSYAPVAGDDSTDTAERAATLYLEEYPKALHIWWGANNYSQVLPPSTCWLVWDKENGTNAFADAELAWTNDKGAVRMFRHLWNGMLRDSERGERIHPTQKPIALCAWAFEKYGAAGDLILDPFLGSGPSLKAAEGMGRTVIGFELSPHYCDHILEWAEAEGLAVERAP